MRSSLAPLLDPPPQGARGHEAHDHDRVLRILDRVDEVVLNPPRLAHAVGRYDDHGPLGVVEALGILDRAREAELVEPEGILVVPDERFLDFRVVALGMDLEDGGGVDGHGRVAPDGYVRDPLLVDEEVEEEDELLGALHGEGGNHHLPAALGHVAHGLGQGFDRVLG
jgi:hypothetical protein